RPRQQETLRIIGMTGADGPERIDDALARENAVCGDDFFEEPFELDRHLGIGRFSEDETYRTERTELVGINEDAPVLDSRAMARSLEDIAVAAVIFTDTLMTAEAIADEVGSDRHEIAIHLEDAHVRDHAPSPRFRIFGVTIWVVDSDNALS